MSLRSVGRSVDCILPTRSNNKPPPGAIASKGERSSARDILISLLHIASLFDRAGLYGIPLKPYKSYLPVFVPPARAHPLQPKLELELIQTQMTQKPMLRAEVGMRVRCANKASAE